MEDSFSKSRGGRVRNGPSQPRATGVVERIERADALGEMSRPTGPAGVMMHCASAVCAKAAPAARTRTEIAATRRIQLLSCDRVAELHGPLHSPIALEGSATGVPCFFRRLEGRREARWKRSLPESGCGRGTLFSGKKLGPLPESERL